jgi:clan AA aspartic protease
VLVEAVIDTGFTGFLTLPAMLVTQLGLPFAGTTRATLSDGRKVAIDVYEATVLWDGHSRPVTVLAAEGGVLVLHKRVASVLASARGLRNLASLAINNAGKSTLTPIFAIRSSCLHCPGDCPWSCRRTTHACRRDVQPRDAWPGCPRHHTD